MPNLCAFQGTGQSSRGNGLLNQMGRNHPAPWSLDTPQQFRLDDVSRRLGVRAHGPALDRVVKPSSRPPMRIQPREVAGHLIRAGFRLPNSVRGHKEPFFRGPGRKEVEVFLVPLPGQGAIPVRVERREARRGPTFRLLMQGVEP